MKLTYIGGAIVLIGIAMLARLESGDEDPALGKESQFGSAPASISHEPSAPASPTRLARSTNNVISTSNETDTQRVSKATLERAAEQGYGNFVSQARISNNALNQREAARILRKCANIADDLESRRAVLQRSGASEKARDGFLRAVKASEQIQRHCQAITPDQQQEYLALLAMAAQGGAMGAATELYINSTKISETPWIFDALRRDADQGDIGAMRTLACDKIGEPISPVQRDTYLIVLRTISKYHNSVSGYAAEILQHCPALAQRGQIADPELHQKLLDAVTKAGDDYIFN